MAASRRVILDPDDRIDTSARIFQLGGYGLRTIVVYPGTEGGEGAFAREVLIALGKDLDRLPRGDEALVRAAQRWLRAEEVEDVVIYGAQRLRGRWDALLGTQARAWLVTPSLEAALALAGSGDAVEGTSALFDEVEPRTCVENEQRRPNGRSFPRIPYDDFFTFIPSAREMHWRGGKEQDQIVQCFYEAYALADDVSAQEGLRESDAIKAFIHRVMISSESIRSAVCRLRGIQAMLFDRWIYVAVDLLPLLALWRFDTLRGEVDDIARSCRLSACPKGGVVATLGHLTDLTSREVASIERRDVDDDGAEFRFDGATYQVPLPLRAFLRLYLESRDELVGNRSGTFLVTSRSGQPVSPHWAAREVGMLRLGESVGFVRSEPAAGSTPLFYQHLKVHHLQRYGSPEHAFVAF
jgi:hypothetical protein